MKQDDRKYFDYLCFIALLYQIKTTYFTYIFNRTSNAQPSQSCTFIQVKWNHVNLYANIFNGFIHNSTKIGNKAAALQLEKINDGMFIQWYMTQQ